MWHDGSKQWNTKKRDIWCEIMAMTTKKNKSNYWWKLNYAETKRTKKKKKIGVFKEIDSSLVNSQMLSYFMFESM